jgi:hypothetical protein
MLQSAGLILSGAVRNLWWTARVVFQKGSVQLWRTLRRPISGRARRGGFLIRSAVPSIEDVPWAVRHGVRDLGNLFLTTEYLQHALDP